MKFDYKDPKFPSGLDILLEDKLEDNMIRNKTISGEELSRILLKRVEVLEKQMKDIIDRIKY